MVLYPIFFPHCNSLHSAISPQISHMFIYHRLYDIGLRVRNQALQTVPLECNNKSPPFGVR